MMKCPYCKSTERQVKAGRNASGSQRIKCQICRRRYTPEPSIHGYPETLRQQALQLHVDGMSLRGIGRQLGIHHKTVSLWVAAHADKLPERSSNE